LLLRVTKIEVVDYEGDVYDLQLETEHNYLLTNGLCITAVESETDPLLFI
jgi:hypothetical protein